MNPFTITYEALFKTACRNQILSKYIKPGNYVSLDQETLPKKSISDADLPELLLTQTSTSGQIIASSSTSLIEVEYVFAAAVGSWDLKGLVSEIQWGLLTSSASWCANLGELTWEGNRFISSVELGSVSVTLADFQINRGIAGWSMQWPLLVRMRLPTCELRNYQIKDE